MLDRLRLPAGRDRRGGRGGDRCLRRLGARRGRGGTPVRPVRGADPRVTGGVMLASGACALGLVIAVWLVSIPLRDVSIIDAAWGAGFVVIAWVCFGIGHGAHDRRLLLAVLVTLWG